MKAPSKAKIPLRFFVSRNIVHACLEITVVSPAKDMGSFDVVGAPLTMQPMEDGVYLPPTLRVSLEDAQSLMDELWNCNVRPSDGTGNLGQVGAMQTNLIDLRAQLVEAWELIKSLQQMVDQLLGLKK